MTGGPVRSTVAQGGRPSSCPAPMAVPEQRRRGTLGLDSFQRHANAAIRSRAGPISASRRPRPPGESTHECRTQAADSRAPALPADARAVVEPDSRWPGTRAAGLWLAVARATDRGARSARRARAGAGHGRGASGFASHCAVAARIDRAACGRWVSLEAVRASCADPGPGCRGDGAKGRASGAGQADAKGQAIARHRDPCGACESAVARRKLRWRGAHSDP